MSETGGLIIQEPFKGHLVPVGDDKALAEGMRWVMEQKKAGSKMRMKCRETVLSRYNPPLQAGRYRELYEELRKARVLKEAALC